MLAVGFGVAIGYAIVALVEALVNSDPAVAIPFACTAATIAGPLAIVARLLDAPGRNGPSAEDPADGNGPGPGGGDDDPTPPWWPEFESEFWARVESEARERKTPVPA